MIDQAVVSQLMDSLRHNVRLLWKHAAVSQEEFFGDETIQYGAKRALQLALQSVIGISDHLIGDRHPRVDLLSELEVIPKRFSPTMRRMVGMRNILVKRYQIIELAQIYNALQCDLGQFDEFAGYIVEYLEKEGIA